MNEVKQLPFLQAIRHMSYLVIMVGIMELIERLGFYGVKTGSGIYATGPIKNGGLGLTETEFGYITAMLAFTMSIIPVVVGGAADRYGYKITIAISTAIKVLAYITAALLHSFWGLMAAFALLGIGTGVFRPGIQGTLVHGTRPDTMRLGWAIFYEMVNIGGYLGPLLAGWLRQDSWNKVFYTCAAIVSINFLMLFTYREPAQPKSEEPAEEPVPTESLFKSTICELKKPAVIWVTVVFSLFWMMFFGIFDVVGLYVVDWVDTRSLTNWYRHATGDSNFLARLIIMSEDKTQILPEGIINVDSAVIMLTCALFTIVSARLKLMKSMMIGTAFSSVSLCLLGYSNIAWVCALAVAIFAVGEMLSSPQFGEYMAGIAPPGKIAMYLGFSELSGAIGGTVEGFFGPHLYGVLSSKENFAREMLAKYMPVGKIVEIPRGEAFERLATLTCGPNCTKEQLIDHHWALTQQIYYTHPQIGYVWYILGALGFAAVVGMWFYQRWMMGRIVAAPNTTFGDAVQVILEQEAARAQSPDQAKEPPAA